MNFGEVERAVFAGLSDVLIPAGKGMPSASQADVAGQWLDRVLAACPEMAAGLKELLDQARGRDPAEFVNGLRQHDAARFNVLAELTAGAYFMNPAIQQAIGYSGQGPRPMDPRPDYMEDGLLESVLRRGPIYRPTPGGPRSSGV